MATSTIPLAVPDELLEEVREAASKVGLSQADVMRQSIKLGLPRLMELLNVDGLKPLTSEEARIAFGPDEYWDPLEKALARHPRRRSVPEAD
jgi:hypothetical protein